MMLRLFVISSLSACSLLPGKAVQVTGGTTTPSSQVAPAPANASSPRPAQPAASGTTIDTSRLPKILVDYLARNDQGPAYARGRALQIEPLYAPSDAFAARWKELEQRRAQVSRAIEQATADRKSNRLDEARRALDAVITPAARDARGDLATKRLTIELVDAELPAVQLLIEIAHDQRDHVRLVEAAADLRVRREVGTDRDHELALWLTREGGDLIRRYAAGGDAALGALVAEADDVPEAGRKLARAHLAHLESYGVVRANAYDPRNAKKGDIVLLGWSDLRRAKRDGSKLTYLKVEKWNEPYDCVQTDKIDSIHPKTGVIRYQQRCKQRPRQTSVSIQATLAGELPAWWKDSTFVVARVEQPGPAWVLANLSVPDLRFSSLQL